jgi:hypothetical protein
MSEYETYSEWENRESGRERDFSGAILFGAGALFGAGLMFLLDPERGGRRRALMRDKISSGSRRVGTFAGQRRRDLANRVKGAWEERRAQLRDRAGVDDLTLVERVRSQVGHVVAHPGPIEVLAERGRVILRGAVLKGEIAAIRERLDKTRGVRDYSIELKEYDNPANIPGLHIQSRSRDIA